MTEMQPRQIELRQNSNILESKERVFLRNYLFSIGKIPDDDVYLTVQNILRIWGYEHLYHEMLDNLVLKVKKNPDLSILVYYSSGAFDNSQERQKLLGWDIFNDRERKFGLVGGIVFQNGKMSFHT